MDILIDMLSFSCGMVIVYRCGDRLDMMHWSSSQPMRLAYLALIVGGAALACSALASEHWLRPLACSCVVAGVTVLCLFDRRAQPQSRPHRREPTAG